MTDREFDLLLRSALLERNREELEDAAHLDPIEPSPRYLRWRMKFLADPFRYGKKHTRPLWRKVLRVALSAVLVIVLTFGAVLAVYPPARQWVARWFETYIQITFQEADNSTSNSSQNIWYPNYLPEGTVLEAQYELENSMFLCFRCPDGQMIYLNYAFQENANYYLDFEHQQYEEIFLSDGTSVALLAATSENERTSLTWNNSETGTAFNLLGSCSVDELLKIASSIQMVK